MKKKPHKTCKHFVLCLDQLEDKEKRVRACIHLYLCATLNTFKCIPVRNDMFVRVVNRSAHLKIIRFMPPTSFAPLCIPILLHLPIWNFAI